MSIAGLILAVVMGLATLAVLMLPYLRYRSTPINNALMRSGQTRDALLTTYERVLSAIRDLDDDFQTGKLAQETYQAERAIWAERGVQVLQKIEAADATPAPKNNAKRRDTTPVGGFAPPAVAADAALDEAVEEAIAKYRKAKSSTAGD